jgi:hypothetical protein
MTATYRPIPLMTASGPGAASAAGLVAACASVQPRGLAGFARIA